MAVVKVNIGVDGVTLEETESGFEAWSKEQISFKYGDWIVYVESNNTIDYTDFDLTLQFADNGKILFSCDSYHCEDEDVEECCKYKNFEITDNFEIQNDYFFIKFIKSQKSE
jgi:hypothetical protein